MLLNRFIKKTIIFSLILSMAFSFSAVPINTNAQADNGSESGIEKTDCGWNLGCHVSASTKEITAKGLAYIAFAILSLVGLFFGLSGLILDFAFQYTVIEMSQNIAGVTSINIAWTALRDISNLFFIFVLLYIAIATILRLGNVNTKQLLVRLVIVALLINFSLFLTKVVIDASNVLAINFYNRATAECQIEEGEVAIHGEISKCFAHYLGVTSLYNSSETSKIDALAKDDNAFQKIFALGIGGSLLLTIGIFVFLAAAVLFVVRYAVLIILMILSPLAFLGFILPKTATQSGKWWRSLLGQAIFAPVYLIMTYVVLLMISDDKFLGLGENSDFASTFTSPEQTLKESAIAAVGGPGPGPVGVFVNFFIVIIFMIATIIIAKQFSSWSGNAAEKGTGMLNKFAGKATFGAAGFAGRRTLGAAGQWLSEREGLKDAAATSFLARTALRGGKAAAKASYDVRGSRVGELVKDSAGVDFGKAEGKGGFEKSVKDYAKSEKEFAEEVLGKRDESHKKVAPYVQVRESAKENLEREKEALKREENRLEQLEAGSAPKSEMEAQKSRIKTQTRAVKKQEAAVKKAEEAVEKVKLGRQREYAEELDRGRRTTVGIPKAVPFVGGKRVPVVPRTTRWFGFGPATYKSKKAAEEINKNVDKKSKGNTIDDVLDAIEKNQNKKGKDKDENKE